MPHTKLVYFLKNMRCQKTFQTIIHCIHVDLLYSCTQWTAANYRIPHWLRVQGMQICNRGAKLLYCEWKSCSTYPMQEPSQETLEPFISSLQAEWCSKHSAKLCPTVSVPQTDRQTDTQKETDRSTKRDRPIDTHLHTASGRLLQLTKSVTST